MARMRGRLPSPAMIVAILALIAALAGTGLAAATLTTKKFKKNAVRGPITYVNGPSTEIPNNPPEPVTVTATCPGGQNFVVGGGVKLEQEDVDFFVASTYPTAGGWAGTVNNTSGANQTAFAVAICAKSKKVGGEPPLE